MGAVSSVFIECPEKIKLLLVPSVCVNFNKYLCQSICQMKVYLFKRVCEVTDS